MGLFVVGMTAKKPFYTQDTAVNDTIFPDCLGSIVRAGRRETAGVRGAEKRPADDMMERGNKATINL